MKSMEHECIQLFPRHGSETDWLQVVQPAQVLCGEAGELVR